jgi:hypothetical protein
MREMSAATRQYVGKYRGIVQDVADPWEQGRLRASVPEILGDEWLGWALPCAPYAGKDVGAHMIPPVGSGVWIEFEAGVLDRPVWVGTWWGEDQRPQDHQGRRASPKQRIIRSETGLHVQLDDERQTLTVSDEDGSNRLEITVEDGRIRIEASDKVIVNAPKIELVGGATHPLAYGDDLIRYLNQLVMLYNTHLHVGQTVGVVIPVTPAPPAAPFPQATPALHSRRVTTG